LALLLKIQVYCYEDARVLKSFRQMITLLYKTDVLSDRAILYWADKGASAQGKSVFLKQMEPFITWLKEADAEDEEEG
jgi:hypothetical protein